MDVPATRYVDLGGSSLAYQIYGKGPIDVLFAHGIFSHLDLLWTDPGYARLMRRLGTFARVISYDRLGVGLSDPVATYPTLDDRVAELQVVLDAAESESAHVIAYSEGGAYAGYLAASQPSRVLSISFVAPWVRGPGVVPGDGVRPEAADRLRRTADRWGEGSVVDVIAPSLADKPMQRRMFATFERAAAGPRYVRALADAAEGMDVSGILPHIRVPCLVIGVIGDSVVPIEHVRSIAAAIPNATLFEVAGRDHLVWAGDFDPGLDQLERFITGTVGDHDVDRMLATVVFTDIVGSTERLAEIGDRRWRALVEEHDDRVRKALDRHGGREVKTLGDGFLMSFDAPHAAVAAVGDIQRAVAELGLQIRAGIHSGDVEIIGTDLAGMTVNTAARICAAAGPDEILVSEDVRNLLFASGSVCIDRGLHRLKGLPRRARLFAVTDHASIAVGDDARQLRVRDRLSLQASRRVPRFARATNGWLRARSA